MKRFLTLLGLQLVAGVTIGLAQQAPTIPGGIVQTAAVSNIVQAEDSLYNTRERWRDSLFRIDKSQVSTGILLEYSLFPFETAKYDGVNGDDYVLKGAGEVFQLHSILRSSIINSKAVLPNTDSLYTLSQQQTTGNTVPLTFLYQAYNRISATAYSRGLLNTTADGFAIIDVANRAASPYDQREVFAFQPSTIDILLSNSINFTLPSELWLMPGITSVSIDFGDGAGFRTISKGGSASVYYATTGAKQLTAQITTTGGIRVAKCTINYTRPQFYSIPDYKWNITATPVYTSEAQYLGTTSALTAKADATIMGLSTPEARVEVENGCDKIFDKPIFILEGFDPDGALTMEALKERFKTEALSNRLRAAGYDFVFVEFVNNGDFIENNAKALEEVIKKVNATKTGTFKSSIIGYSMGGLIARWCLRDMEDRGLTHQVANYFSYDAPHQGANIPLGLQCLFSQLILDMPYLKLNSQVAKLSDANNSIAARQMLVKKVDFSHNIEGNPSKNTLDPIRKKFAANLLAKGYPRQANNYGIALGRGDNTTGSKEAGNGAQWNFTGGARLIKADILFAGGVAIQSSTYANPADGSTGYITRYRFQGITGRMILGVIPVAFVTVRVRNFKATSQFCYDDAPGSFSNTQTKFGRSLRYESNGMASDPVLDGHYGHNFVPTVSALDLQDQSYGAGNDYQSANMFVNIDTKIQNPFLPEGSTLADPLLSPFKAVMTGSSNCTVNIACPSSPYLDMEKNPHSTPGNHWNNDHNDDKIQEQFGLFIGRKILSAEPPANCNPSGKFCDGVAAVTGPAHFCTTGVYSVLGLKDIIYEWTVSNNLQITGGQNTNQITVSRIADGYGTITVTLRNLCQTQYTLTKSVHMGAPDPNLLHVYGPAIACPTDYNTYIAFNDGVSCIKLTEQGVTTIEWGSAPVFDAIIHNPVPDICSQIYDYSAKLKFRNISGMGYSLKVRATNSCGTSPWSANTDITLNSSGCGGGGGTTFTMTTTPNPASNDIFVDIEENTEATANILSKSSTGKSEDNKIIITDLMGNVKLTQKAAGNLKSFRINVSMLPEGNYILNVTHKGVSQGKQIIISH